MLSDDEKIIGADGLLVGEFWRWAYSDILSNRNRAIFAEFLVASALGQVESPRVEWDAVDVYYDDIKVEVKSAAYLQSWEQKELSTIRFDIAKKKPWYAKTNTYGDHEVRASDVYVFCLFGEKDKGKADVLNVGQWRFYVVATDVINDMFGDTKSVSLKRLEGLCRGVCYSEISSAIDGVVVG